MTQHKNGCVDQVDRCKADPYGERGTGNAERSALRFAKKVALRVTRNAHGVCFASSWNVAPRSIFKMNVEQIAPRSPNVEQMCATARFARETQNLTDSYVEMPSIKIITIINL